MRSLLIALSSSRATGIALVVFALLAASRLAGASPVPERVTVPPKKLALAVNLPTGWLEGFAYGASGYVALSRHQALRVNVAQFHATAENLGLVVPAALLLDTEDETERRGGFFDVAAGWMYFPRRVWSGPTFELGALVRTTHMFVGREFRSPERQTIDTTTTAGRVLVGWHWDVRGRLFLSIAIGASIGYERGTHVDEYLAYSAVSTVEMTVEHDVSLWKPGFEWCSRLGVTF